MKLISRTFDGHRREYSAQLTKELKAVGLHAEVTTKVEPFTRDPLVFMAIEDHPAVFASVASLRSTLGLRTVGLLFRPGQTFSVNDARHRIKRSALRILSRLPNTSVLTLLPHDLDARFSTISNGWIFDPQLWDLASENRLKNPPQAALQQEMTEIAGGRRILVSLGEQNRDKGFEFLANILGSQEFRHDQYVVFATGRVSQHAKDIARGFTAAGGILIDRMLTDDEFLGAYYTADVIWNCYAPQYDQASGVFGRAVQLGVPSVIRAGSYLERLADMLEHEVIAISPADRHNAARAISTFSPSRVHRRSEPQRVERLRAVSMDGLLRALTGAAW
jgi:hypothetical protein